MLPFGYCKYKELRGVRGESGKSFVRNARNAVYLLITITLGATSHPHLLAQQVTSQATPPVDTQQSAQSLPDAPGQAKYGLAEVMPEPDDTTAVELESDTQSKVGSLYVLGGDVVITYRDRTIKADHVDYDSATGELKANGHLHVTGGPNHEDIKADHGTMNLNQQTGRFYDVTGSVGMKNGGHSLTTYASSNPFLFTGRMVVRTGPQEYEIYDGTLTTCQLPDPDWMLSSGKIMVNMDDKKANAQHSIFHLMDMPLLYLPYVTHPVDSGGGRAGF